MRWRWLLGAELLGLVLRTSSFSSTFTSVGVKLANPDSYYFASILPLPPAILVFISPVFFALTLPAIYLTTRRLFNERAAKIAMIAFAVVPGEYLSRSMLGDCDHHALEVFIVAWLGWLILRRWQLGLGVSIAAIGGGLVLIGGTPIIHAYFTFLSSNYSSLTSEVAPPLSSPLALAALFNITLTLVLLILSRPRFLFILWTLAAITLTLWQRRFDYYLIVNLAILCGWGIDRVIEKWKMREERAGIRTAIAVLIFLIAVLPASYNEATTLDYRPSDEWVVNLERLEGLREGNVLAWWDYGYWIEYIAKKKAITDPGQDINAIREVASFLASSTSLSSSNYPIPPLHAHYVIVDRRLVEEYTSEVEQWAGVDRDAETRDTLAYQLYYYPNSIPNLTYLFGDTVKVFEVRK